MGTESQAAPEAAQAKNKRAKTAAATKRARTSNKQRAGVMAAIRACGGMTRAEIAAECATRKLSAKSAVNYAWAARQAGLLKP